MTTFLRPSSSHCRPRGGAFILLTLLRFNSTVKAPFGWRGLCGAALAAALLGCAAGCGSQVGGKFQVSGTVNLNGNPLDKGGIRFSAADGSTVASGAMVRQGRYLSPAEKGLPPGKYSVSINAADESAPPVIINGTPTPPNRIPDQYNVKTTLVADVTAEGDNVFPFDLTSAPSK